VVAVDDTSICVGRNVEEKPMNEHQEQLKLLVTLIRSLADREITAHEAGILCRAAAELLATVRPKVKKWYIKLVIHSAVTGLGEASDYFEELNNDA